MALTYQPKIPLQAGQIVTVSDPDDTSMPNKQVRIPAMLLADASGAQAGTAANPLVVNNTGSGGGAQQVQGNVANATTDSGNPVKGGAVYRSTAPTYTDGQRTELQAASNGELRTIIASGGSTVFPATTASDGYAATNVTLPVQGLGRRFNGATWDRDRKPNGFSRIASTAATGSPTLAKASAGDMGVFWGQNGGAITYLQFYNQATAPTVGTSTIVATFPIPAGASLSSPAGFASTYFSAGLAYAFTTDAAGTTAAAAGAVTAFLFTYA